MTNDWCRAVPMLIQGRSNKVVTPHGDALERLAWIAPAASSLVAFARASDPWPLVRHDPGAILLLLRSEVAELPSNHSFCGRRLQSPALFDLARSLFDK